MSPFKKKRVPRYNRKCNKLSGGRFRFGLFRFDRVPREKEPAHPTKLAISLATRPCTRPRPAKRPEKRVVSRPSNKTTRNVPRDITTDASRLPGAKNPLVPVQRMRFITRTRINARPGPTSRLPTNGSVTVRKTSRFFT